MNYQEKPATKEQWEVLFFEGCKMGDLEMVKSLCHEFQSIAEIHAYNEYGFRLACENGHLEVVKFLTTSKELFEAGHSFVDIHTQHEEGFRLACERGHIDVVKFLTTSKDLLQAGHTFVDIHSYNEEGFRGACLSGHLDIIQFLTMSPRLKEAGHTFSDIHVNGEEGIRWACEQDHWNIVKWLVLDYRAAISDRMLEIAKKFPRFQSILGVRSEYGILQKSIASDAIIQDSSYEVENPGHHAKNLKSNKALRL